MLAPSLAVFETWQCRHFLWQLSLSSRYLSPDFVPHDMHTNEMREIPVIGFSKSEEEIS